MESALRDEDLAGSVDDVEGYELARLGRVSPLDAVGHELVVLHVLVLGLGDPLMAVDVAVVLQVLIDALETFAGYLSGDMRWQGRGTFGRDEGRGGIWREDTVLHLQIKRNQ